MRHTYLACSLVKDGCQNAKACLHLLREKNFQSTQENRAKTIRELSRYMFILQHKLRTILASVVHLYRAVNSTNLNCENQPFVKNLLQIQQTLLEHSMYVYLVHLMFAQIQLTAGRIKSRLLVFTKREALSSPSFSGFALTLRTITLQFLAQILFSVLYIPFVGFHKEKRTLIILIFRLWAFHARIASECG